MKFSIILVVAFYIPVFSNYQGVEIYFQISTAILIVAYSARLVLLGKTSARSLNVGEMILLTTVIVSVVVSGLSGDSRSFSYSIIVTAILVSISITIRSVDERVILNSLSIGYILAIVTIFVFQFSDLFSGLRAEQIYGRGLARFTPFGMHPNLTGLVYGVGSLVLFFQGMRQIGLLRLFYFLMSLCSGAIILAASARASILAVGFVIAIVSLIKFREILRKRGIQIAFGSLILFVFVVLKSEVLYGYINSILEIESETRGLSSGGTGRFDLWVMGFDLLRSRGYETFFGSGLRTAGPEQIGFLTESSYITILLESGLFLGLLFIAYYFSIIARLAYFFSKGKRGEVVGMYFSILMFVAIQSVFNRYLIAIGNTASLCVLFLAMGAPFSLNRAKSRLRQRQPRSRFAKLLQAREVTSIKSSNR